MSYFSLVDENINRGLLVDHKNAALWLPPGGHVEPDEDPKDTVKRELIEELGVEAEFLLADPFFTTVTETVGLTAGHTDVSLWYVLKGNSEITLEYDEEEFHKIHWFNTADVPYEDSDPHMKRFIQKLLNHGILR